MHTICVVTGTRAEYGLLKPLLAKLQQEKAIRLQIVVTGMHLSSDFGLTYTEIENDGFTIHQKIECSLSLDTKKAMAQTTGHLIVSFSEYFESYKSDLVIVLGDRYEIFAASVAVALLTVPVAHISGGDTTEGAVDEFIRHSITKMAYLHFVTTEIAKKRVIQLGEAPERVFAVGSLGVENIQNMKLLSKRELEESIKTDLSKPFFLVTFHPVTIEQDTAESQFGELLKALDDFKDYSIIITKANSDAEGRKINALIDEYEAVKKNVTVFTSLGALRYLSAMKYARLVIGNSSSGICETPSFRIPTVNIGDRQKGRVQSSSVINCTPDHSSIVNAITTALTIDCSLVANPYEGNNTSDTIVSVIKRFLDTGMNLKKTFYDL